SVNGCFHNLTGINMYLYTVTDWLSVLPLGLVGGFAALGLFQWIKRKSVLKVDSDIFVLGAFYVAVMAAFIFFEKVVINYRPILIDGLLEASYPSSTTMLVMCVMPTAIMQFNERIKTKSLRQTIVLLLTVFTVFMVVGRLVSGVHWLTDIIGGALLSAGFVMIYRFVKETVS
ncbi:MAG: phosphatase PAP2 family protein, partial [Clostridia bacterium]|nr:phosphatase PAP2 family protein [Clostridia bacterium]